MAEDGYRPLADESGKKARPDPGKSRLNRCRTLILSRRRCSPRGGGNLAIVVAVPGSRAAAKTPADGGWGLRAIGQSPMASNHMRTQVASPANNAVSAAKFPIRLKAVTLSASGLCIRASFWGLTRR